MKTRHRAPQRKLKLDWLLVSLVLGLTLFGLIMVFDASIVEAIDQFSDKYHFVRLQTMWIGLGLVGFITGTILPVRIWQRLATPLFAVSIFCLIAVLIPGLGTKVQGARRWLNIGLFGFQPSELAKLTTTIYFSSWLSRHQRFLPFAFLSALIIGLIMLQPDMGTSVVITLILITLYFLSGAPLMHLAVLGATGLVSVGLLIATSPYRLDRVKTFLDPTSDPLGASYHIRQVLIALGSGGLFGQGIGRSLQKYQYLPEATTDSIFAVIAEETGFIGGLLVISSFLLLIKRGYAISGSAKTPFTKLLAAALTTWLGMQALVNLAAMVALVPLTGIPLPFISYGGSSLVMTLTAAGILVGLSRSQNSREATTNH